MNHLLDLIASWPVWQSALLGIAAGAVLRVAWRLARLPWRYLGKAWSPLEDGQSPGTVEREVRRASAPESVSKRGLRRLAKWKTDRPAPPAETECEHNRAYGAGCYVGDARPWEHGECKKCGDLEFAPEPRPEPIDHKADAAWLSFPAETFDVAKSRASAETKPTPDPPGYWVVQRMHEMLHKADEYNREIVKFCLASDAWDAWKQYICASPSTAWSLNPAASVSFCGVPALHDWRLKPGTIIGDYAEPRPKPSTTYLVDGLDEQGRPVWKGEPWKKAPVDLFAEREPHPEPESDHARLDRLAREMAESASRYKHIIPNVPRISITGCTIKDAVDGGIHLVSPGEQPLVPEGETTGTFATQLLTYTFKEPRCPKCGGGTRMANYPSSACGNRWCEVCHMRSGATA